MTGPRRWRPPQLATALTVAAAVAVVAWQLQPRLLLSGTLATGGDTGAHVATVDFLRTVLLPRGHLTGWDPGWYDGFPLYTFYFLLPDALAAVAGTVVNPNVAFKLATALGSLSLPVAAWAFGRLAGLERPRPAVLAAATLPFLFDQTFTIDGGNLYSTMAGEYSFSLALALALVFLGLCLRGMRTGRSRAAAAVVLAASALAHVVPTLFAVAGAVVVLVVSGPTPRRWWWMVSTGVVGGALVAFWAVPFLGQTAYTTSMGWHDVHAYAAMFAPGSGLFHGDRWVLWLAAAGTVTAVVRRSRPVVVLVVLGWLAFALVVADPFGAVYNARFLPMWWVAAYLVAGSFVAEVGVVLARAWRAARRAAARRSAARHDGRARREAPGPRWRAAPGAVGVPLASLAAALLVVLPPLYPQSAAAFGVAQSSVPSWVRWDYSGYQAKPGWPELQGVVRMVDRTLHRTGCGRVMWEYSPTLDRFGTPMALMLLPMLTGGCADTQEGLLFESSATTPYHFVDQAELSAEPSEAMAGLPYPASPPDVAAGVAHLQLLGVRYFLASSPAVETQAAADPALTLLATSGPWRTPYDGGLVDTTWALYRVHGAATVTPLARQPAVLTGVGQAQGSWLPVALRWYGDPARWSTELVATGPARWPRTDGVGTAPGRPLPPDTVSDVRTGAGTVSFRVSRPGVPVLVKVSYFPGWHAAGALGPYRAEPNLMVVVPTGHRVVLTYGSTPLSTAGLALSGAGLVGLGVLALRRRALAPVDT